MLLRPAAVVRSALQKWRYWLPLVGLEIVRELLWDRFATWANPEIDRRGPPVLSALLGGFIDLLSWSPPLVLIPITFIVIMALAYRDTAREMIKVVSVPADNRSMAAVQTAIRDSETPLPLRTAKTADEAPPAPGGAADSLIEVEPLDGDDWARIRVQNGGPPMRFQVKVERLGPPVDWRDPYAAPWREYQGEKKREPWQFLANGDQGVADLVEVPDTHQLSEEGLPGEEGLRRSVAGECVIRLHSAIHPEGHEDHILMVGTEVRCVIAVLREQGSKIVGEYVLRVERRRDDVGRGLVPTVRFTRAEVNPR